MENTIVVTGVNGFVGQHLAKNLRVHGNEVIGIGREPEPKPGLDGFLNSYLACDLTDTATVELLKPYLKNASAVINLAGIATTNNDPAMTDALFKINTGVHDVLYGAMCEVGSKARVIAVCTGLEYSTDQAMPLTEESSLQEDIDDTNAYVRTKLRVEKIADKYRAEGLEIIIARPFNHTGPSQGGGFFVPDQIKKIQKAVANDTKMDLGDGLDFWRDFTDVRDVVEAYRLLATLPIEKLTSNIYNIASGTPVFGRDLFRLIAAQMQFTNYDLTASNESSSPKIYGSHDLLTKDTGWQTTYSLQQSIADQL